MVAGKLETAAGALAMVTRRLLMVIGKLETAASALAMPAVCPPGVSLPFTDSIQRTSMISVALEIMTNGDEVLKKNKKALI